MSTKKGRARDVIWHCFDEADNGSRAVCKGCGHKVVNLVVRMRAHTRQCSMLVDAGLMEEVVDLASDEHEELTAENGALELLPPAIAAATLVAPPRSESANSLASVPAGVAQPKKRKLVQPKLRVVRTNSTQQADLDLQICRFILAANVPFRVVENEQWKLLLQKLRPGVKCPSRRSLGGSLLETIYKSEIDRLKGILHGRRVQLSVDGWSAPSRDSVLGIGVTVGDVTYLMHVEDMKGRPHTADTMAGIVGKYVQEFEETFACRVVSLATDNAANMNKMRSLILDERRRLLSVGCMVFFISTLKLVNILLIPHRRIG